MPTLDEWAASPATPKSLDTWAATPTTPGAPAPSALDQWVSGAPPPKSPATVAPRPAQRPSAPEVPTTGFEGYEAPPLEDLFEGRVPGYRPLAKTVTGIWNLPHELTGAAASLAWELIKNPGLPLDVAEAGGEALGRAIKHPISTAHTMGTTALGLLFGENVAESVAKGSLDPLMVTPGEAKPSLSAVGDTAAQIATNWALMGGPAKYAAGAVGAVGAAKAYEKIPAIRPTMDWLGKEWINRWGWTDPIHAAGAAKQGEIFAGTAMVTLPAMRQTAELEATSPWAAQFLEPRLGGTERQWIREVVRFEKARTAPGGLPINPLTGEQNYFGRHADFAIDSQGYIRNLAPERFAKLGWDDQQKILNLRAVIDKGTNALKARNLLDPEQFDPGYLRREYAMHVEPYQHRQTLRDPLNPESVKTIQAANAYFTARKYTNPEAMTDFIVENGEAILAGRAIPSTKFPFAQDAVNLIQRKEIPTPVRALLGPLEPGALRVGSTIDYQNRVLGADRFMEAISQEAAADGRPYMYVRGQVVPATGQVLKGAPHADYRPLDPDSMVFGRWRGSWLHPDIQDTVETLRGDWWTGEYMKYYNAWRAGKVVYNPPTWFNNVLGDALVFSSSIGTSAVNPRNWQYYSRGAKYMWDMFRDPAAALDTHFDLRMGIAHGAVIPGFASAEIAHQYAGLATRGASTGLEAITNLMVTSPTAQKLLRFYDLQDQFFRMGSYLTRVYRYGDTYEAAALQVAKGYPNYEYASPVGRFLRGQSGLPTRMGTLPAAIGPLVGGPFSSFPMETMRIYSWMAKEHPYRLMGIGFQPLALVTVMSGLSGLTPLDYLEFQRTLPSNQRGKIWAPMGKNKDGDQEYWNMSSIFPLGEMAAGGTAPLSPLRGPAATFFEMLANQDFQTGEPIYDEGRGRGYDDWIGHMFRGLSPLPTAGMTLVERRGQAAEGLPYRPWEDEPETVGQSLARSLFPPANVMPESYLEEGRKRQEKRTIMEGKSAIKGAKRRTTLSDREREDRINRIRQFMEETKSGAR